MISFASALFRKKRALRFFPSGAAVPAATRPLAVPAGVSSGSGDAVESGKSQNHLDAFSLTPALSRWEREKVSQRSLNRARRMAVRLDAVLPLPAGEGRGEGDGVRLEQEIRVRHQPVLPDKNNTSRDGQWTGGSRDGCPTIKKAKRPLPAKEGARETHHNRRITCWPARRWA